MTTDRRDALLERIRDETRQAVIEGDAQDCSSADCIADAVYEIARAALEAADPPAWTEADIPVATHEPWEAADPPALDVERLAKAVRHVSPWSDDDAYVDVWTDDALEIATEYARLAREEEPLP